MKLPEFDKSILISLLIMLGIIFLPLFLNNGDRELAIAGIIDLTEQNWDNNSGVNLEGEWKFTDSNVSSDFFKPDYDDSSWSQRIVPGRNYNKNKTVLGAGYYRLKVKTGNISDMAIYCEKIYSAYELYINGQKILSAGTALDDKEKYVPQILPQLSHFSADSSFTIAIKTVNFDNKWNSIITAPRIGKYKTLIKENFRIYAFDLVILGCLIMTGLYHLFLWYSRRTNRTNLFFSLLCLIAAIYLTGFRNYAYHIFPYTNRVVFHTIEKLRYISISILPLMLARYFYTIFPKEFSKKIIQMLQSITLIFIVLIAATNIASYDIMLFTQLFFSSLQFFWISVCLVIAVIRKREYAQSFLIGYFIINSASLNDFFAEFNIIPTVVMLPTAVALFVIIQSNILSTIFIKEYSKSLELGLKLSIKVEEKQGLLHSQQTKLESALQRLKNNDRYKNEFIKSISNKLKVPLSSILENLKLSEKMFKTHIPEQAFSLLRIVRKNSLHLDRLIEQLIDLTRIESGKEHLNLTDNDIISFIENIVSHYRTAESENRVKFEYQENDDFSLFYFDADKMEKLIRNLLSNALKFSPKADPVLVYAMIESEPISEEKTENRNPQTIIIKIKDTGPGIPENKIPYIFNRFYQLDDSSSRETQGLGIGLSLVKEYVEMHYGSVSVDSGDDGSTFILKFPIEHQDLKQLEKQFEKPQRTSHIYQEIEPKKSHNIVTRQTSKDNKETILVVEDNMDLREYLIMNLETKYHIISAENGLEALEIVNEEEIDIIVTDIMMPKMDGFQFREALLSTDTAKEIPFLFLTAKAEISDQIKGLEQGAVDYIVKPFNIEKLTGKIHALLSLRQAQKQQQIKSVKQRLSGFISDEEKAEQKNIDFETLCFKYRISTREKEILLVLKEGLKNNEIAQQLNISPATVKNHLSSIFAKCLVKNRAELIKLFT